MNLLIEGHIAFCEYWLKFDVAGSPTWVSIHLIVVSYTFQGSKLGLLLRLILRLKNLEENKSLLRLLNSDGVYSSYVFRTRSYQIFPFYVDKKE